MIGFASSIMVSCWGSHTGDGHTQAMGVIGDNYGIGTVPPKRSTIKQVIVEYRASRIE